MQSWQELIKVALLGTAHQTKMPVVDEPLKPYINQLYPTGLADGNREVVYLSAAALISAYYRAGRQPERFPSDLPAPKEIADYPVISATATAHLRLMLSNKELAALLPEWLQGVADAKQRLTPLLLPQMLDRAAREISLRPAIVRVIGQRGRWLARHHEEWQRLMDGTGVAGDSEFDNNVWETGVLSQRVVYLRQQRTRDPQQARVLLQDTWKQDTAKDRVELLETLQIALQDNDEAFLETCLGDKSKAVRQCAAGLLARLPDSALSRSIKKRLQTWLSYQSKSALVRGFSKKKGQLTVNLPEQWDKAWQQEGISEKAPSGKGQKAWWLEQTLALVAPTFWCAQWNLNPTEVLALLPKHEWEAPLRSGLYQAIIHHKDPHFSAAWLATVSVEDGQLWQLLALDQRERLVTELIARARGGEALIKILAVLPHLRYPWSETFSTRIVDAWQRLLSEKQQRSVYYLRPLFKSTALCLHISNIDYFKKKLQVHPDSESPNHKQIQDTLDTLYFRQAMLSAIKKR